MAKISKRTRKPKVAVSAKTPFLRRKDRIKLVACLDHSLEHQLDFAMVATENIDMLKGCEEPVLSGAIRVALRVEFRHYGRSEGDISYQAFLAEGSAFLRFCEEDLDLLQEARRCVQVRYAATGKQSSPATPQPPAASTAAKKGSLMPAPRARRSVIAETASPQTPEPHARAHYPSQQFPHSDTHIRKNQLEALEEELAKRSEQLQAALKSIEQQKDYIFALSNRLSSAERECKSFEHSVKKATDLQNDITAQSNLRYELKVLRDQHIKMEGQRRVVALSQDDEVRPSSQSVREEFELLVADLKDACSSVNITIPAAVNPSDSDMTEGNTALESWSRRLTGLHFGRLISHALQTDISDIHLMTALTATGVAELVFESSFPDFLTKSSPMLDQYREHILTKASPQTLGDLDLLAYHSLLSNSDDPNADGNYFHSHVLVENATTTSEALTSALDALILPRDDIEYGFDSTLLHSSFSSFPSFSAADFDNANVSQSNANTTVGSEPEAENALAAAFVEPIQRALKLKANLILSARTRYKLAFPHPGDIFVADTMIRDGESQVSGAAGAMAKGRHRDRGSGVSTGGRQSVGQGHGEEEVVDKVKLCLLPSLWAKTGEALPRRGYGVGVNVRNCLLECDNFVRVPDNGGEEDNVDGFTLVVKAVVLV